MITFVDNHRANYGVESICRVLPIAPSTYYARLAVRADPTQASPRYQRDIELKPKIQKVWDDNWKVCGPLYGCSPHGRLGLARYY
jgi:putative transposase